MRKSVNTSLVVLNTCWIETRNINLKMWMGEIFIGNRNCTSVTSWSIKHDTSNYVCSAVFTTLNCFVINMHPWTCQNLRVRVNREHTHLVCLLGRVLYFIVQPVRGENLVTNTIARDVWCILVYSCTFKRLKLWMLASLSIANSNYISIYNFFVVNSCQILW